MNVKHILEIACLIGSIAIIALSMVCMAITGECSILFLLFAIAGVLLGWLVLERIKGGK